MQYKLTVSNLAVSHPRRHVRYYRSLWSRRRRSYLAGTEPIIESQLIYV